MLVLTRAAADAIPAAAPARVHQLRDMIIHISSVIVPVSEFQARLHQALQNLLPNYEIAAGLLSVSLSHRSVVAYVELLTISNWESEESLRRFLETCPQQVESSTNDGMIYTEPHTYEIVAFRGRRMADLNNGGQHQE
jgi:heme-degrading monooxygenase HmoA